MQNVTREQLRNRLKQNQSSLTRCRQAIFEIFDDHSTLSMNQLTVLLPDVDRATIYRTVNLFENLGIINRSLLGWKYKLELSDSFSPHHHHLSCNNCGKITVLSEDPAIESHIAKLSQRHNFQTTDHQLEIRGLCPACQKLSV